MKFTWENETNIESREQGFGFASVLIVFIIWYLEFCLLLKKELLTRKMPMSEEKTNKNLGPKAKLIYATYTIWFADWRIVIGEAWCVEWNLCVHVCVG